MLKLFRNLLLHVTHILFTGRTKLVQLRCQFLQLFYNLIHLVLHLLLTMKSVHTVLFQLCLDISTYSFHNNMRVYIGSCGGAHRSHLNLTFQRLGYLSSDT